MTKKEMIEEMIEGLRFRNNTEIIKNRLKNNKKRIEGVYDYFLKSKKEKEDKLFCIRLLIK